MWPVSKRVEHRMKFHFHPCWLLRSSCGRGELVSFAVSVINLQNVTSTIPDDQWWAAGWADWAFQHSKYTKIQQGPTPDGGVSPQIQQTNSSAVSEWFPQLVNFILLLFFFSSPYIVVLIISVELNVRLPYDPWKCVVLLVGKLWLHWEHDSLTSPPSMKCSSLSSPP